jgi:6-phosphogluconolactonase/glucosamine-6-phosphate isomerase/deaminase
MTNIAYVKINSIKPATAYLFKVIKKKLGDQQKVLWMIPGGSSMDIVIETAKLLQKCPNLDLLTVTLTDERYGRVGHKDSNWQQLVDRRFQLPGAKLQPVLEGLAIEATAKNYSDSVDHTLKNVDYAIALAGMGPDGHIFGIKPGGPAVDSQDEVVAYKWDDYARLTPTFNFIKRLDEVVVYAVGAEKHQQIDDLQKDLPPTKQPAQFLKQLKKVTIFNDYKGVEV